MIVIGLDPGYEQSALVAWDGTMVVSHTIVENEQIVGLLGDYSWPVKVSPSAVLVIEQIESMGMAVGKTTFETVFWSGRFAQAFLPRRVERLPRRAIKLHLCGSSRATDSNIRQALIDRFGPSTEKAIGKKASPGPLYGITSHKLAALAVALTFYDQHANDGEIIRPGIVAAF